MLLDRDLEGDVGRLKELLEAVRKGNMGAALEGDMYDRG